MILREFNRYSVYKDTDVVRLEVTTKLGVNYWAEIEWTEGRSMRRDRERAIEALEAAANSEAPEGEVCITR